jgi:hypothetical protein
MCVVSVTSRPLYLQGKSLRYPWDRRLGGPQSRSGRYGEVNILDPTGSQTPTPQSSSQYLLTILTELSRFKIDQDWNIKQEANLSQISLLNFFIIFIRGMHRSCVSARFNWKVTSRILIKSGTNIRLCTTYEEINFINSEITIWRTRELMRLERQ